MVENVLAPTGNFSIGNGAAFNLVTCNEFYGFTYWYPYRKKVL